MTWRDLVVAHIGAALVLGVDRFIDGRPAWTVGYLMIVALLYAVTPKPA